MPDFLRNLVFQVIKEGSYIFGKQTIHSKKESDQIKYNLFIQRFQSF
jgi:hypothetical protein